VLLYCKYELNLFVMLLNKKQQNKLLCVVVYIAYSLCTKKSTIAIILPPYYRVTLMFKFNIAKESYFLDHTMHVGATKQFAPLITLTSYIITSHYLCMGQGLFLSRSVHHPYICSDVLYTTLLVEKHTRCNQPITTQTNKS
jgi:hypothetical protein